MHHHHTRNFVVLMVSAAAAKVGRSLTRRRRRRQKMHLPTQTRARPLIPRLNSSFSPSPRDGRLRPTGRRRWWASSSTYLLSEPINMCAHIEKHNMYTTHTLSSISVAWYGWISLAGQSKASHESSFAFFAAQILISLRPGGNSHSGPSLRFFHCLSLMPSTVPLPCLIQRGMRITKRAATSSSSSYDGNYESEARTAGALFLSLSLTQQRRPRTLQSLPPSHSAANQFRDKTEVGTRTESRWRPLRARLLLLLLLRVWRRPRQTREGMDL